MVGKRRCVAEARGTRGATRPSLRSYTALFPLPSLHTLFPLSTGEESVERETRVTHHSRLSVLGPTFTLMAGGHVWRGVTECVARHPRPARLRHLSTHGPPHKDPHKDPIFS